MTEVNTTSAEFNRMGTSDRAKLQETVAAYRQGSTAIDVRVAEAVAEFNQKSHGAPTRNSSQLRR